MSGKIKRANSFEKIKGFKTVRRGKLVKDYMPDDQALFVVVKGRAGGRHRVRSRRVDKHD